MKKNEEEIRAAKRLVTKTVEEVTRIAREMKPPFIPS